MKAGKNIINYCTNLVLLCVVIGFGYCVYWVWRAGQGEKGWAFAQQLTRFTLESRRLPKSVQEFCRWTSERNRNTPWTYDWVTRNIVFLWLPPSNSIPTNGPWVKAISPRFRDYEAIVNNSLQHSCILLEDGSVKPWPEKRESKSRRDE